MVTKTVKIDGEDWIEYEDGRRVKKQKWHCRSTDEKPKHCVHNSETIIELDTGKGFVFDEEVQEWNPLILVP